MIRVFLIVILCLGAGLCGDDELFTALSLNNKQKLLVCPNVLVIVVKIWDFFLFVAHYQGEYISVKYNNSYISNKKET